MHLLPSFVLATWRSANGGDDGIDHRYDMACLNLQLLRGIQAIFAVDADDVAVAVVVAAVAVAEPTSFDAIVAFPGVPSTVFVASCVVKEQQMPSCY